MGCERTEIFCLKSPRGRMTSKQGGCRMGSYFRAGYEDLRFSESESTFTTKETLKNEFRSRICPASRKYLSVATNFESLRSQMNCIQCPNIDPVTHCVNFASPSI
jgi:hypothetical protein